MALEFPKHQVAVDQRRRAPSGIERQVFGLLVRALGQVDDLELERQPDLMRERAHFPGVGRRWEAIEFHWLSPPG